MKPNPMQQAEDKRHEARFEQLAKQVRSEAGQVHVIPEAQDNPRLEAMNQVLQKRARRKIN